jgi:hypothetical protein
MSHSTHVGFRLPPICSLKGLEFFSAVAWLVLPLRQSLDSGVANLTASTSWICLLGAGLPLLPRLSLAIGVGHKPQPVALVRRPNVGSSQHCPSAVIPERGQITNNDPKAAPRKGRAVLHEDVAGSNLANDAGHFSPQP